MPRKTGVFHLGYNRPNRASMRPRPDAAENLLGRGAGAPQVGVASMRPRPDAAENRRRRTRRGRGPARFNEAAARCRGKPRVMLEPALSA